MAIPHHVPHHLDALTAHAYAAGIDPLDWACALAAHGIESYWEVRRARESRPRAHPDEHRPVTTVAYGRHIIGRLLDAGWRPPDTRKPGSTPDPMPYVDGDLGDR